MGVRRRQRQRRRGVTLVEVLIVVAIIGVTSGLAVLGGGATSSARLRRSAAMIASAIRVAYGHANATSRSVRLVLNLESRTIGLEEADTQLWLAKNDRTGGAMGATEAERKAIDEADSVLKGPHAPRASFKPVKTYGFNTQKDKPVKELEPGIRFLQVETSHQDEVVTKDQAYIYFWPGGQTERAAVQLGVTGSLSDGDVLTVLVAPLTGKADIRRGRFSMLRPRDDSEASERQDTGF
jgi:general secretion pathway protein H